MSHQLINNIFSADFRRFPQKQVAKSARSAYSVGKSFAWCLTNRNISYPLMVVELLYKLIVLLPPKTP